MTGPQCSEHTQIAERIAKVETDNKNQRDDIKAIFDKIQDLSDKFDEAIRNRLTKGVTLVITSLTGLSVGLVTYLLTRGGHG